MKRVAVVTGPTASGKSWLAVELALRFNGEVVSADSMQIYRGMDIGTAKPDMREMRGVPHHMLDIAAPGEQYSVSRYEREARECVEDILSRGRLPIICGGTGLYIDGLIRGGGFAAKPDEGARMALEARFDSEGGAALLRELERADPETARKLHHNDRKRIVRALEVLHSTGEPISAHNARTRAAPPRYEVMGILLNIEPRSALYARIDSRVDHMLEMGLEREVKELIERGELTGTAAQSIGYKELAGYLKGLESLESAAETIKRKSRNYAKRQITWLRAQQGLRKIVWDGLQIAPALCEATNFLCEYGLKCIYGESTEIKGASEKKS